MTGARAARLVASLSRLGQSARARNGVDLAAQGELSLDGAAPIEQAGTKEFGAFEDDAISEQDDVIDICGMSAEHLAIYSLDELRDAHRMLSELLVTVHRELAKVARPDNLKSLEVRAVRDKLAALQAQRARLDAVIEDQVKAIKERRRAEARVAAATSAGNEARGGLVKVRHPNRDFFLADLFDYALKDDGVSMEAPIFTLSTRPDLSTWSWTSKDGSKHIEVFPSVKGRATQFDKDVLIYVISQMTEALNRDRDDAKHRTVRFTVYDYLVATNRPIGGSQYDQLEAGLNRLRGTSINTDIRTGGQRVREGFGVIDSWSIVEKSPDDERMISVEVTLSKWLFNAVQAREVLTIHPDYFRLRKPLARRLYEISRKHCGHQAIWRIGLALLQEKAGSKGTLREFRRMVREIIKADTLPEYRIVLNDDEDTVTFHTKDAKRLLAGSIAGRP